MDIQTILPFYIKADTITKIKTGQSGADVYDINGEYILKYAEKACIGSEKFKTYTREVWFYDLGRKKEFIPEIIKAEV